MLDGEKDLVEAMNFANEQFEKVCEKIAGVEKTDEARQKEIKDRIIDTELQQRKLNLVVFGLEGVEKDREMSMRMLMKQDMKKRRR